MRAVNIIALVLVFILFVVAGYYMDVVSSARWAGWFSDYDMYGSSYYGPSANDLTMQAGGIMLIFVLFYAFAYIGNLVKVKTTSSKVMCIIGLSFTFLTLLVNLGTLGDPGGLSFDESGAVFILYGIINLAFFIVLLVQSVNYYNRSKKPVATDANADVIDMEIE